MPGSQKSLIMCLFLLALFSACKNPYLEDTKQSNALHLAFFQSVRTLDPAYSTNEDEMFLVQQLFDGLVDLDDAGRVVPAIAKSWELSEDALTYTFHLRQDIYFQDDSLFLNNKGRKMRASDVVSSFHRVATETLISPGRWIFNNLNRTASNKYKGFMDLNDSTLCIYLNKPDNAFLKQLSLTYCSVIPIEIADYYGANFGLHPIGSGAYKMKVWKQMERIVLQPNHNHYEFTANKSLSIPEFAVINLALGKPEAFNQFLNGKIDWFFEIDDRFKNEIIAKDGKLIQKFEDRFMLYRPMREAIVQLVICNGPNSKSGSGQRELLLRRAIAIAIERDRMQVALFNNLGSVATQSFIPNSLLQRDSTIKLKSTSSKEQAEQLFERGGYLNSTQRATLILGSTKQLQEDAKFLQQNLSTWPLQLQLVTEETEVLNEMLRQGDLDLVLKKASSSYAEPAELMEQLFSTTPCLYGTDNTNLIAFNAASALLNKSNQNKEYLKIEHALLNEARVIPLYFLKEAWLINHNFSAPLAYSKSTIQLKSIHRNRR